MKILVIAAHPDDEVLGLGGTIAKHVNKGDEVYVCIVAEGATVRYERGMINELKKYALQASEILGVKKVHFLGFPDQKLDTLSLIEIIKPIEKIISNIEPEIVYTHHYGDLNKDHQIVFEATVTATRPIGNKIKKVLCYETPSSTEWSPPITKCAFMPNVYTDISDTLQKKIEAMMAYKSEVRNHPHPRSIETLRINAQYQGSKIGVKAAERFMLIREII